MPAAVDEQQSILLGKNTTEYITATRPLNSGILILAVRQIIITKTQGGLARALPQNFRHTTKNYDCHSSPEADPACGN